jgi:hypothetical protein
MGLVVLRTTQERVSSRIKSRCEGADLGQFSKESATTFSGTYNLYRGCRNIPAPRCRDCLASRHYLATIWIIFGAHLHGCVVFQHLNPLSTFFLSFLVRRSLGDYVLVGISIVF